MNLQTWQTCYPGKLLYSLICQPLESGLLLEGRNCKWGPGSERSKEDQERVGLAGGWAMFPLECGEDYEVLIREEGLKVRKLRLSMGWSSL